MRKEDTLIVKVYEDEIGVALSHSLWTKELEARKDLGSDEVFSDWYTKLCEVANDEDSFNIVLRDSCAVEACALVCEGMSLHHNNLAIVFGMVSSEGYGTKLIREIIKESKRRGYSYVHFSMKITNEEYRTKVIKLKE